MDTDQTLSPQPQLHFLRRLSRHWPEIIAIASLVLAAMYCAGGVFLVTATRWAFFPLYTLYSHSFIRAWMFSPYTGLCAIIGLILLPLIFRFSKAKKVIRMLATLLFAGLLVIFGSFAISFRTFEWLDSAHVGGHIYRLSYYGSFDTSYTTLYQCDRLGVFCDAIFTDNTWVSSESASLHVNEESGAVSLLIGDDVLYTTTED